MSAPMTSSESATPSSTLWPAPRMMRWSRSTCTRARCSSSTRRAPPQLYAAMGPTTVDVRRLGGQYSGRRRPASASRPAFIGKVKDDDAGREFAHDIRSAGVAFDTPFAADGAATARCLILVTPDGQRTMSTFLGACQALGPDDVDEELVRLGRHSLSRGLSLGPAGRQGGLSEGRQGQPRRRPARGALALRRVLRRPLSRRVLGARARRARRYSVRQ